MKTGGFVFRETTLPGAILTHVAASHLRIGTFEYFAAQKDFKSVKLLANHAIARHYPQALETPNRYQIYIIMYRTAQAALIVDWMRVEFIHGVMNTDNMAETIDYGPVLLWTIIISINFLVQLIAMDVTLLIIKRIYAFGTLFN